jgi:hypothetical protein
VERKERLRGGRRLGETPRGYFWAAHADGEIKTLRRYRKPIAQPECRNEHDAALVALVASGVLAIADEATERGKRTGGPRCESTKTASAGEAEAVGRDTDASQPWGVVRDADINSGRAPRFRWKQQQLDSPVVTRPSSACD